MENLYHPLVSVIIPAYNAQAFIDKTLASVLAQTYRNLEILVVDDGSSDRTVEIVQKFAGKDQRIRLLQQPNAGVAAARNLGMKSAQGEFIAPLDADDICYPNAIAKLVAQFQTARPEVGVVYAWSVDIDEQDRPTGGFHAATVKGTIYKTLICHNFLGNASCTLIRKQCLDLLGGYDPNLKAQNAQGCEDWDLYLRLAQQYEFDVVPEFLVGYRKVFRSMSGDFQQMARSQQLMLQTVQKKHPEIPGYLYRISRSSFYLYLAQQCDLQGNPQSTLFWLGQAVRVDFITPFGRLGFYILLLKSLTKQLLGGSFPGTHSENPPTANLAESERSTPPCPPLVRGGWVGSDSLNPIAEGKINRFQIWLKVFVGNLLHHSLSRV